MDSIQAIQARLDPYPGALQPGALDRFPDQLGGTAQPCVIMPDPPTPMSAQSARREEIVVDPMKLDTKETIVQTRVNSAVADLMR